MGVVIEHLEFLYFGMLLAGLALPGFEDAGVTIGWSIVDVDLLG
jgi:hypothetical protein